MKKYYLLKLKYISLNRGIKLQQIPQKGNLSPTQSSLKSKKIIVSMETYTVRLQFLRRKPV